jgi:hypothetical protein
LIFLKESLITALTLISFLLLTLSFICSFLVS